MIATRAQVKDAMDREADYQDSKGYHQYHAVGEWLLIMMSEMQEAHSGWVRGQGDHDALREILQVMTVGMRCLEQHGIVDRD